MSAIQTMHHLHVVNINCMRNDSLQYKMCKKPCLTQPDDTQLAKGEKNGFLIAELDSNISVL